MKPRESMDDQAEMRSLFNEHVLPLSTNRATAAECGAAWLDVLEEAERAGRAWATRRLSEFRASGATADAKSLAKSAQRAFYKTEDGEVHSLTTLRGTTGRNDNGEEFHQQTLLGEMTKDELDRHVRLVTNQRDSLTDRLPSLRRLQRVYERHLDAPKLAAACAAEGLSVEEILMDEAAA